MLRHPANFGSRAIWRLLIALLALAAPLRASAVVPAWLVDDPLSIAVICHVEPTSTDAAGGGSDAPAAPVGAHCPWCMGFAHAVILPPGAAPVPLAVFVGLAAQSPRLISGAPLRQSRLAAQPRAPPAAIATV